MAAVFNLILTKQVTADQLVTWLLCSSNKVVVPEPLQAVDNLKTEFVPFFLNFLRDQSSRLIQNGQPTGQTPVKLSEKIIQEKEQRQSAHCASRVELFPSPSSEKLPSSAGNSLANTTKCGSRNNRKQQLLTPSEVVHSTAHSRTEPRSQQKLNLGQFIVVSHTNHRKKVSPTSLRKDGVEESVSSKPFNRSPNLATEIKFASDQGDVLNLSDIHDFPPVGTTVSSTKKGHRRRITPTAVRSEQHPPSKFMSSDVKSESSSVINNVFSPLESDLDNTLQYFMRNDKDRALIQSITASNRPTDVSVTPQQGNRSSFQCNTLEVMIADPKLTTLKDELDSLVAIYSACITGCLVPNLCVELYFLIQLLTVRGYAAETEIAANLENGGGICYLGTIHNCVYFAAEVLHRQQRIMELLDKGTLRLLADNPRVETFCPDLRRYLAAVSENLHSKVSIAIDWSIGSVPFQTDTDNRNNFPGEQAFRAFRKQRDLFYELLREWEANHMSPSWTMSTRLGNRIHSVVTMWSDPVVYSHFARLFMSQLIAMCKGNVKQDCQDNVLKDGDFLIDLRKSNPEKFKRLQERFVTPRRVGGPVPLPSFPGAQEFFRDFIVLAGCPKFNQHLIDCLLFKLIELNSTRFTLPEKEMQDNIDDTLRQHFMSTCLTLRLLGKFLGFVLFLPYQNLQRLPEDILADQIQTRNKVCLALDVTKLLQEAVVAQHTLLTVPWIVELLSMMDCVAPLLDDINRGLIFLIQVYRSSFFSQNLGGFSLNQLFLLLLVGWLFETPNFPPSLFFAEVSEIEGDLCLPYTEVNKTEGSLDCMPLIDRNLLYICCPFLAELKVVLSEFASGIRSRSNTIKKITPVAATDVTNSSLSSRKLELQLEEHFFHNQPSSVRKTVEFVSERMTSNIIKQMRKSTIPTVRKEAEDCLRNYLQSTQTAQHKSSAVLNQIEELAAEKCIHVRKAAEEFSLNYCEERIHSALSLLLAEEIPDTVLSTCCKIAFRLTQENVVHWITRHVTNSLFNEDLRTEWARFKAKQSSHGKTVKRAPSSPNTAEHSGTAKCYARISCTDVMVDLKAHTKNLYSYGEGLSACDLNKLLEDVECTLIPSQELTSSLQKGLGQLSLELLIGLAVLKPETVTDEQISRFIQIWKCSSTSQRPAPQIICSRSLLLLMSTSDLKDNWLKLASLLVQLLDQEVLSVQDLKDQCLSVLKHDMPKDLLQIFSRCLESVATKFQVMMPAGPTTIELLGLRKTIEDFSISTVPTLLDG